MYLNDEEIRFRDEDVMKSIRGGRISIAFQDPMNSLNPSLPIGEQIAEAVRIRGSTGESISLGAELKRKIIGASKNAQSWRRAIELLEEFQIPDATSNATAYPHQLSGGMRQRVMLAIALAGEPDLLIADEPTTALDVTTQAQILEELLHIRDEFGMALLLITHNLGVIAEVSDKVNIMYAGEIIEKSPTDELFSNPQHPYTQGLLASTPDIDTPDKDITPISGSVPALINLEPCHFAPRCPESDAECFSVKPEFRAVGPDHEAACLHRPSNTDNTE